MMHGTARMVRLCAAVAAAATLAVATGCSFMTPTLAEVESRSASPQVEPPAVHEEGVLTVALGSSDAPLSMVDNEGALAGYSVDLAAALADELGLDVKFVDAASPQIGLEDAAADIYLASPSSDADEDIDVVGTVLSNATAVFVKSDGSVDAASLASDMAGARVAVQDQSASQDVLARSGIQVEQVTFSNVNECFEALEAGEADYVVCEAVAGEYIARSCEDVVLGGTLGEADNYGVAISADNLSLSDAVEEALDGITVDGTLEAVYARWFGRNPLDLSTFAIPGVEIAEDAPEEASDASGAAEDAGAASAAGADATASEPTSAE